MEENMVYREKEFSDSEIGKIPRDWDSARLQTMGGFQYGITASAIEEDTGTKLLRITDIKNGGINWEEMPNCKIRPAELRRYEISVGDVLFARIGATTGKTCYIDKSVKAVFGSYLIRFLPKTDVDTKFLYFFAQSKLYWDQVNRKKEGQLKKGLNIATLGSMILPRPPFQEQHKIAAILMIIDGAIQKTNEIIAKTRLLKKGLMQQLLTKGIGHKDFKYSEEVGADIPKEWKVVSLGDVTIIRYGLGRPPESDENGVPMIRATNIKRGAIVETGLFRVKRSAIPKSRNPFLRTGDVIVVRSGAYTGDIARVTEKWEGAIAGYDLILSPTKRTINSVYLANYLLGSRVQTYFSRLRVRAAQPHLNSDQVSRVLIPLPSLTEQEQIARTLSVVDKKLEIERNEKANLQEIKQALMDLLLTGKIRIKVD